MEELRRDPALSDQPYTIEPSVWGRAETPAASNRHGRLQAAIAAELSRQLQGMVLTGCSILTSSGMRSPDVAWASPEFMRAFGEITPYTRAPEICVEIVPAAIVAAQVAEKVEAYLAAGADEVWLVGEDGSLRYVGPGGEQAKSRFPVAIVLPAPLQRPS